MVRHTLDTCTTNYAVTIKTIASTHVSLSKSALRTFNNP